jgi:hypothetical protein
MDAEGSMEQNGDKNDAGTASHYPGNRGGSNQSSLAAHAYLPTKNTSAHVSTRQLCVLCG